MKNKRVPISLLSQYLDDGWIRGRYIPKEHLDKICPSAKGKLWFHLGDGTTILRHKNDTASLLSKGWKLGRKPSNKTLKEIS